MKAIKSLLAVSILAAAGAASAATVTTTNLNGTSSAPSYGNFGHYTYLPAPVGAGDTSTNVYSGTVRFTTDLSPIAKADVTYQFTLAGTSIGSTVTSVITNCTNSGANQCNSSYSFRPAIYILDSYNFSDPAHLTWTVHNTVLSSQLGEDVTTTFSWSGYAVPVPASAWLFGSGLIGLTGAKRRRAI